MTEHPFSNQLRALTSNEQDDPCNCDEFKKALEAATDSDWHFLAVSVNKGKYEIACIPINFCPWCGKRISEEVPYNDPQIMARVRGDGEPNRHFKELPHLSVLPSTYFLPKLWTRRCGELSHMERGFLCTHR